MKDYQEFVKTQKLKLQTLSKAVDEVDTRREALEQIQSVLTPKVQVNTQLVRGKEVLMRDAVVKMYNTCKRAREMRISK